MISIHKEKEEFKRKLLSLDQRTLREMNEILEHWKQIQCLEKAEWNYIHRPDEWDEWLLLLKGISLFRQDLSKIIWQVNKDR